MAVEKTPSGTLANRHGLRNGCRPAHGWGSGGTNGAAAGRDALMQEGAKIELDIPDRRLDLLVPSGESEKLKRHMKKITKPCKHPALRRYAYMASSAGNILIYKNI